MSEQKFDHTRGSIKTIRMLAAHPALPTTLLIGGGGIALAFANIIYAKLLGAEDFGRLVLMQAIAFVAMGLLPLGFDMLIARHEIEAPLPVIRLVLTIGAILIAVVLSFSYWILDVSPAVFLYIFIAGTAGAATRLFASILQRETMFLRSQFISQAAPLIYLGFAIAHSFTGASTWQSAANTYILSVLLGALIGYQLVRDAAGPAISAPISSDLWYKAIALAGILASLLLLNQMGLFIAAGALGMREVGALGLATTLIASPFRLFSHGVGYTLVPRMAACQNETERRKLLLHEFMVAMGVGVPGAIALFLLVPPFVNYIFADEYSISMALTVALIAVGLIRLNTAVVSAAINALAGTKALQVFNLTGWVSAVIAAGAAFLLSDYGATGIVAGVSIGWVIRMMFASILIRKELCR